MRDEGWGWGWGILPRDHCYSEVSRGSKFNFLVVVKLVHWRILFWHLTYWQVFSLKAYWQVFSLKSLRPLLFRLKGGWFLKKFPLGRRQLLKIVGLNVINYAFTITLKLPVRFCSLHKSWLHQVAALPISKRAEIYASVDLKHSPQLHHRVVTASCQIGKLKLV